MKDATGENHYSVAPFDNSESDSSITQEVARRCGASESVVVDIIQCWQELSGEENQSSNNAQKEIAIERFARQMVSFRGAPKENYLILYALDSRALDDVIGNCDQEDFARMFGVEKATINKALEKIRNDLNLPPRKDQRNLESRQKMSKTRKSKLTSNEK